MMERRHIAVLATRGDTCFSLRRREWRMREVVGHVTIRLSRDEFPAAIFGRTLTPTCGATRRLRNVDDLPIPTLAKGKPHAIAGEEGVANFGQCSQRIHGVAINCRKVFRA
jgi:hypothetical protein